MLIDEAQAGRIYRCWACGQNFRGANTIVGRRRLRRARPSSARLGTCTLAAADVTSHIVACPEVLLEALARERGLPPQVGVGESSLDELRERR